MEDLLKNHFLQSVVKKLNEGMSMRDIEAEKIIAAQSQYLINNRIDSLKKRLLSIIGFDFEKCDLKPCVTGTAGKGDYVIEKILIQSLPGYYVPIHLYKPAVKTQSRYPAVLVPMGHYIEGKNLPENQIFCANLALQGYVVLTFDPIFQGERDVFPEKKERHAEKDKWVVAQHMMGAMQGYLLGEQITKFYLWDGIRALDYLCMREDVDVNSIGCCGQSGGGTQTAYLSAIDPRIKVSVPVQYITSVEYDLLINGVGDAEQATFGLMKERIDKTDLLWMFAPKPVLINASLKDIFPLEGTVKTAHELKKLYSVFGAEDRISLVEIDTEHYLSKGTREASYLWFNRWLKKQCGFSPEKEISILSNEQLSCGYEKSGSLTVFDMYKASLNRILKQRSETPDKADLRIKMKSFFSNVYRDEYTVDIIDKRQIEPEGSKETFRICTGNNHDAYCELLVKDNNDKLLVLIDMNGTLTEHDIGGYFGSGYNVLTIKPFGMYQTAGKSQFFYDVQSIVTHCIFADANDLVSIRTNEILCCFDYIRNTRKITAQATMIGTGQGALLSLVSGLYEDGIDKIVTVNMLASYKSLFEHKEYFINESDVICGFLRDFDICDLVSASPAVSVTLLDLLDGQGNVCSTEYARKEYAGTSPDDTKLRIAVTDDLLEGIAEELLKKSEHGISLK